MTERPEHIADESAFAYVKITVGSDDNAYVTAMYANHKAGPRSEGYVVHKPDGSIDVEATVRAAQRAATRDYPGLAQQIHLDD